MVNEIQADLGIPNSTLCHHLDKLNGEDLVTVQREGARTLAVHPENHC